jgi:hypothetical protein
VAPPWYAMQARGLSPAGLGLLAYPPPVSSAPCDAGVGLRIPERQSDCSGIRPSWYPFVYNVCDWEFDPVDPPLTWRQTTTDPPPA